MRWLWLLCVFLATAGFAPPGDVIPPGGSVASPLNLHIFEGSNNMSISIGTVYSTSVAEGASGSTTWTITGISVPSDATACIVVQLGYIDSVGDVLDISNFDGDSDDHFTHIVSEDDGDENVAGAWCLKYGETGFPNRGATGQTFTGSFTAATGYDSVTVILFFLSGTVTDGTFIVGTDTGTSNSWTSWSLGTGASDWAFVGGGSYKNNITTDTAGQTEIHVDTGGEARTTFGYEEGEDTPEISGTAQYAGFISFAVKAAAGGTPGLSIPVAMHHLSKNVWG